MVDVKPLNLSNVAWRWGLSAFALGVVALGGLELSLGHVQAQAIAQHNSRAPVTFDAGRIELQDRQNRVALSNGVIVTQAGLTVRSQRMLFNYTDTNSLDIQRITATGGVIVSRGNEQARGDTAIYDLSRRIITLAGNVELNRGGDRLTGGRLVIDLATGLSSVDGRASTGGNNGQENDGRVTGTFSVPQQQDESESD